MSDERAVVLGRYSDGSGLSEVVYGPYKRAIADDVAKELTAGQWHGMCWEAMPIGRLPGEQFGVSVPVSRLNTQVTS